MSKTSDYRARLRELAQWEPFLLSESGLPGPRSNLELAQAVADEGDEAWIREHAALGPEEAPVNEPRGFLAMCGVVGLGRLLVEGQRDVLKDLQRLAQDPRWRIREAVAMALQRWGDADVDALLAAVSGWVDGPPLVQRAAAAALCEPRLLRRTKYAAQVLRLLDRITASLARGADRRSEEYRTLRQGLGYCWSVAIVALPEEGKTLLEKWSHYPDGDVRWLVRENLKKNRLRKLDPAWVTRLLSSAASEEGQQGQTHR